MTMDELRASNAAVLTVSQTTRLLRDIDGNQLDERTVRRALEDGQLPGIKVGTRWLVPREQLLALLTAPDMSEAGTPMPASATTELVEGALPNGATPAA